MFSLQNYELKMDCEFVSDKYERSILFQEMAFPVHQKVFLHISYLQKNHFFILWNVTNIYKNIFGELLLP